MSIKKFTNTLLITIILAGSCFAQSHKIGLGSYLGIGEIKSNSPSFTSFAGSFFIDYKPAFAKDYTLRFNFIYARKINYFLPENRTKKEYPFMKAFVVKIYMEQHLTDIIYAEGGIGPLILNDRTFSDINVWNYGLSFSVLIGLDFCDEFESGIKIGIGVDYGTTFNNTAANYYFTYIQFQYNL